MCHSGASCAFGRASWPNPVAWCLMPGRLHRQATVCHSCWVPLNRREAQLQPVQGASAKATHFCALCKHSSVQHATLPPLRKQRHWLRR